MKKTANLLALLLALAMALSLAACSAGNPNTGDSSQAPESTAPAESAAPSEAGEPAGGEAKYVVGICQLAPIPRWTPPPRASSTP